LDEENPRQVSKLVAHHEGEFSDFAYVLEQEKQFREIIKNMISNFNGIVFGGAIRDEILGEFPRDYDALFSDEVNLSSFLKCVTEQSWSIFNDETSTEYFWSRKVSVRKIKIYAKRSVNILSNPDSYHCQQKKRLEQLGLLKTVHTIEIPIDVIYYPNSAKLGLTPFDVVNESVDMDVNQLYIDDIYGIQSKVAYMNKDIAQIKKQILRKEFKMLCKNDSFLDLTRPQNIIADCVCRLDPFIKERKKKMEDRGWTCINKPCDNPYCLFATQEAIDKEMMRLDLDLFGKFSWKN
jgi:hypothetical protein